jgi:hypothetical protein
MKKINLGKHEKKIETKFEKRMGLGGRFLYVRFHETTFL